MLKLIFACSWYLLPAALGNHTASCGNRLWLPVAVKGFLAKLAVPVDLGATWRGREIFGKSKTWRGLLVGVLTGVVVSGVQAILFLNFEFFKNNTLVDYGRVNFFFMGALLGGGALVGDIAESFVKRRLNKPSGKPWFPWDQADWIIGGMVMSSFLYTPPFEVIVVTLLLYIGVHLCSDRVVYRMGIKKREEVN